MNTCRVCRHPFFEKPLLRYENMPKSAQYLPDKQSLENDNGIDLEVCQCSGCGLVQLSNDPVPYYKEVIRAAAFSEEMKKFRRRQFAGFVESNSLKGKKVIEIGCGRGEYLSLMRDCGVRAYGLEYLAASVRCCVAAGLNVARGFIPGSPSRLKHAPFDAFVILNFLEHLPDPNAMLRGIGRNLIEGGLGLVEVPNLDMMLRRHLFSEFASDHLLYFTKHTLTTALNINGFDILDCREVWHDYILSAVVRKRKPLDLASFRQHQARLKKEIMAYLGRFGAKNATIWGAGHQALAVMALMGLGDKIRCVVDSAPFKQGKYTPATHIPIVSPDTLASEPVAAVIVMAAAYSDEVAGLLRKQYHGRMSIAILRDSGLEVIAPEPGAQP